MAVRSDELSIHRALVYPSRYLHAQWGLAFGIRVKRCLSPISHQNASRMRHAFSAPMTMHAEPKKKEMPGKKIGAVSELKYPNKPVAIGGAHTAAILPKLAIEP